MTPTNLFFIQLAVILGVASIFGIVVRLLKLPILIAYLITGLTLATLTSLSAFDIKNIQSLSYLPNIGIAFALFFIGMELDLSDLKSIGLPVAVGGIGQIIIAGLFGFLASTFSGFPIKEAVFLGLGLSFSSTVVVVKMLTERKDLTSLYGKLALGVTLLEDLVSILILMALTVGGSYLHLGLQNSLPLIAFVLKASLLFGLAFVCAKLILPKLLGSFAKSQELLFLFSITWCFIYAGLASLLGFSIVIGAFLAGVTLARSAYHLEIQGKVKPLRDFFVTLFFIYLGSQVSFHDFRQALPLVIVFTLYALCLKPLIFLLFLGAFGFKKHTIFQAAISLSQISEFSLIILILGVQMGLVSSVALTTMALTGLISIICSTILISRSKLIYRLVSPIVAFFESSGQKSNPLEDGHKDDLAPLSDHVVLIGAHRMGGPIAQFLKNEGIPLAVLDFNPKVVQKLTKEKIAAFYGDISDPETIDLLGVAQAKLVISTASDPNDNQLFLKLLKEAKVSSTVVVRAQSAQDAKLLYKEGADYVILPEVVAGDYILQAIAAHWPKVDIFKDRAAQELNKLTIKQYA